MKKSDFRKVIFTIGVTIDKARNYFCENKYMQNGLFHKWVEYEDPQYGDSVHGNKNNWALVEDSTGEMVVVDHKCIKFVD